MNQFSLRLHETFFLIAGLATLIGAFWFEQIGAITWPLAKIAYLVGVILFVAPVFKTRRI